MPIQDTEKNTRLQSPPLGQEMAPITALNNIDPQGRGFEVRRDPEGDPLPEDDNVGNHLQGVAVTADRSRIFLTTSSDDGQIIAARDDGEGGYIAYAAVGFGAAVHPGGVQLIGRYLVIPVYHGEHRAIEFRDIDDELALARSFDLEANGYCVGITTVDGDEGEYYLLAVVTEGDGSRVDFYHSPPGMGLSDDGFDLAYLRTYRSEDAPAGEWHGFPNNFALLSDTNNNPYLLGLYKTAVSGGEDQAVLYHIRLENPDATLLNKKAELHVTCNGAPAFRWGATAVVTDDQSIELFACERNAQVAGSRIAVDRFAKPAAPVV